MQISSNTRKSNIVQMHFFFFTDWTELHYNLKEVHFEFAQ